MNIDLLIESEGLFRTSLPTGAAFTWRLLTLKEYKVFCALRDNGIKNPYEVYWAVFDRCYVGDPMLINGNIPAGIFLSIGQLILYLSGDNAGQEAAEIEAARSVYALNSVTEVMKRIVLIAFPSYTPDMFDEWTRAKLVRNFVVAEAVLANKGGYEPIDTSKIMSPEEAEKAARKKGPVPNMRGENQELRNALGNETHPLDRHPSELADRSRKQARIKARHARALDKSMAHERAQRGAARSR